MTPKPKTARDYEDEAAAASRVGLAEIMTALGAYRDALVLIGGWAPYLILEQSGEHGAPVKDSLFQFQKMIPTPLSGRPHSIHVDFLTPRPLGARGAPTATARSSTISGRGLSRVPKSLWHIGSGTSSTPSSQTVPRRAFA